MNPVDQLIKLLNAEDLWEGQITLHRNEHLVRQGQVDTRVYVVKSGSLQVYMYDGSEKHCIRFGYKASFMATLDSFITEKPTALYIQAIKHTVINWISKRKFMQFIQATPENTRSWQELLGLFVVQQMEREMDLLTSSPHERYQRVLARSPHLFQLIPHKYIASYLRMTPETLSRIKSLDLNQGK